MLHFLNQAFFTWCSLKLISFLHVFSVSVLVRIDFKLQWETIGMLSKNSNELFCWKWLMKLKLKKQSEKQRDKIELMYQRLVFT